MPPQFQIFQYHMATVECILKVFPLGVFILRAEGPRAPQLRLRGKTLKWTSVELCTTCSVGRLWFLLGRCIAGDCPALISCSIFCLWQLVVVLLRWSAEIHHNRSLTPTLPLKRGEETQWEGLKH